MVSLATRKRLAAPVYWLGWRLIRLADKIDGMARFRADLGLDG